MQPNLLILARSARRWTRMMPAVYRSISFAVPSNYWSEMAFQWKREKLKSSELGIALLSFMPLCLILHHHSHSDTLSRVAFQSWIFSCLSKSPVFNHMPTILFLILFYPEQYDPYFFELTKVLWFKKFSPQCNLYQNRPFSWCFWFENDSRGKEFFRYDKDRARILRVYNLKDDHALICIDVVGLRINAPLNDAGLHA